MHIPINDITCRIKSPLMLIPLTLMSSTMVGRLWRVHTTLKVASSMGRRHSASSTSYSKTGGTGPVHKLKSLASNVSTVGEKRVMHFLSFLALSRIRTSLKQGELQHRSKSFRQATTLNDTIRLIIILSMPQIIFQICEVVIFESKIVIDYNQDSSIGREICEGPDTRWTGLVSTTLLVLNYVLAVMVAHFSRDLPTAFNEKDQIFQVAWINAMIGLGIIVIMALSRDTADPNLMVSFYFPIPDVPASRVFIVVIVLMPKLFISYGCFYEFRLLVAFC